MRRRIASTFAALLLAALPALAEDSGTLANRGACRDGSPYYYLLVDGLSNNDCSVGGGTYDVPCLCANGAWTNAPAGAMVMGEYNWKDNASATVITTGNTYTKVAISGTLSMSENFDSPSNGRLRYIGSQTVMAHCGLTYSVKSAGANDAVAAIYYQNGTVNGNSEFTGGTALTAGKAQFKLAGASDIGSTAIHVMPTLAPNDYLEIGIKNITDADDLTITDANLFCVTMPFSTSAPSNGDKGDITVSSAGSVWTIDNDAITEGKLKAVDSPADEEFLTYETTTGDFEWQVAPTRLSSWNNPPSSAHSYDDEFDSGTLAAKWTRSSSGTTNPVTTGTIDYTASLTTPITDLTSVPSVLMFQSDNSVNGFVKITQTYTPATNETHFFKILSSSRDVSTNGEGALFFSLINSTDANEVIGFGSANSGTVHNNYCYVNNNGTISGTSSGSFSEVSRVGASYLVVWKKGNDYYFGMAGEDKSLLTFLSVKTKTGVTTFDRIEFFFQTANETPSVIDGLDFYRYKASLDYSLVNP